MIERISVGEEANNLKQVLIDVADNMERNTNRQLELFVRVLEPVMLSLIAGATLAVFGQQEDATSGVIWLGCGLALVGLVLVVLFVVRRARAAGATGTTAPPQHYVPPPQYTPPPQPAKEYISGEGLWSEGIRGLGE